MVYEIRKEVGKEERRERWREGRGGEGGRTVKGVPLGTGNREEGGLNSIGGGRDRHRDGQLPNRVNAIADSTMETEKGDREREGGGRSAPAPLCSASTQFRRWPKPVIPSEKRN